MSDDSQQPGDLPDEMSEYLQMFLDETEEQLEDLVETMLVLERESDRTEELNEAFRLIHSIKGSAGIMGFENITALTHRLENRFERFRSGLEKLNEPMTNLVLRCIDFLRDCTQRLRAGQRMNDAGDLVEELRQLEEFEATPTEKSPTPAESEEPKSVPPEATESLPEGLLSDGAQTIVRIVFEPGLQLVDLKVQLILSRLSGLGEIQSTLPTMEEIEKLDELAEFEVTLDTTHSEDEIRAAADVAGVEAISFEVSHSSDSVGEPTESPDAQETTNDRPAFHDESVASKDSDNVLMLPPTGAPDDLDTSPLEPELPEPSLETTDPTPPLLTSPQLDPTHEVLKRPVREQPAGRKPPLEASSVPARALGDGATLEGEPLMTDEKAKKKVVETLRVDIDRLDTLMNLAGELVVNRARFVQVSSQITPALRKANVVNRLRDFRESVQQTIDRLHKLPEVDSGWTTELQALESGLELLQEQAEVMENGRRCFGQISEAIDQLTRVSDKLQRGVLETRMVPVGPLFNRFKRVVRDLAVERGKKVKLELRGEKTELDKRMIDELGDPLVHLVRNSIDHGLESPEIRAQRGKPEVGTIVLEANHSGNNVYVRIQDDGNGIDVEKVRQKVIEKGLLSFVAAEELPDEEVVDYIWHPGFSTAQSITNVSGRGVGMDVVKTRILDLNGTIQVESIPTEGTTFTIRLPLTLAIINSLLVRTRDVIFSIPISDVREIVSIQREEIVSFHGRETFDVRGEFIPLVSIDDVFEWHDTTSNTLPLSNGPSRPRLDDSNRSHAVYVVILQSAGKLMGLRVDELLGGEEIVIKSLSENFVTIRGLSGASILGDGTVCLMLDVAAVIDLAVSSAGSTRSRTRQISRRTSLAESNQS
ncbi:MAG: chemotaxis protein CheW [Gemmataceae bacterium]